MRRRDGPVPSTIHESCQPEGSAYLRRLLLLGVLCTIGGVVAVLAWQVSRAGPRIAPTGSTIISARDRPKAPDFSLATLDDQEVRLSDLRGSFVLLNFWASWCAPCRQEAPVLASIRQPGLRVVGVNVSDFRSDASAFMQRYGLDFLVLRDGQSRVAGLFGVSALPETFLIDPSGHVAARIAGPVKTESLAPLLTVAKSGP